MRYLPLILILILVGCSKPTQETSSIDSTATASDTPVEQSRLITLTPDEMEQVHLAVFLRLHEFQLFSNEPGWTAYKEEYNIKDNTFDYLLIRSNRNPGFYQDILNVEGGRVFQDPQEIIYTRLQAEQEAAEANTETPDEPQEEEEEVTADDAGVAEEESEEEYSDAPEGYYINEYDTLAGSAMFTAMLASEPESAIKIVRCRFSGYITWQNYYTPHYGEPRHEDRSYPFGEIVVQLGTPQLTKEQLYLKAKILPLTDKDIAGMSKEEISYLRNEIFARHGHTFKTDKMKAYFQTKDWYYSMVDDAAPLLNKSEKQNVEFLKKKEG